MTIKTRTKKDDSLKVNKQFHLLLSSEQDEKLRKARSLGFNIQGLLRPAISAALDRAIDGKMMS
jgi:hypothetical protein